ncbi:MAG: hypothetical protein HFJ33_00305 [Clostridia bacterium]|nr:hypothetical protein [Clostridia bacterium]
MKETALREVAKSRIRKMVRENENEWVVLKYDTPDEKVVPKWQLTRYRELLKEEADNYQKEKERKSTPATQKKKVSKKRGIFGF